VVDESGEAAYDAGAIPHMWTSTVMFVDIGKGALF
jgi:hypothetical protein